METLGRFPKEARYLTRYREETQMLDRDTNWPQGRVLFLEKEQLVKTRSTGQNMASRMTLVPFLEKKAQFRLTSKTRKVKFKAAELHFPKFQIRMLPQ
jgi:hypothetical protein